MMFPLSACWWLQAGNSKGIVIGSKAESKYTHTSTPSESILTLALNFWCEVSVNANHDFVFAKR